MTYEATVQFKFDATYTPTYGSGFGSTVVDDFIPEEHYLITAPAADLNSTQYFCKQAQDTYGNYADFIICNPQ